MWRASTCGFVVSYHWSPADVIPRTQSLVKTQWFDEDTFQANFGEKKEIHKYTDKNTITQIHWSPADMIPRTQCLVKTQWYDDDGETISKEKYKIRKYTNTHWLVTTGHQQMWFHERSLWSKHNDVMMTGSRRRSRKKFINIKFRSIKLILRMVMILDFLVTCSFSREVPCYVRSWSKYICIYVLWEWKESSMRQGPLIMQNTYVSWIGNEKRITLSFC